MLFKEIKHYQRKQIAEQATGGEEKKGVPHMPFSITASFEYSLDTALSKPKINSKCGQSHNESCHDISLT